VRRGSVLVVDDEPKIRQALVNALKDDGHDAVAAPGGREALALISERSFDLAVVDNLMPNMTGL